MRINRSSYDFLEYRGFNPIGKQVAQVLPGLRARDLEVALKEGYETYSVHVNSQNQEIVVNISPIIIGTA